MQIHENFQLHGHMPTTRIVSHLYNRELGWALHIKQYEETNNTANSALFATIMPQLFEVFATKNSHP